MWFNSTDQHKNPRRRFPAQFKTQNKMRNRIKTTRTVREKVQKQNHWVNRPVLVKRNTSKVEKLANILFGEPIPA